MKSSPLTNLRASAVALSLALVLVTLVLVVFGSSPLLSLGAFYFGPLSSGLAVGNTLNETLLLSMTGLAAAIAFSAGSFNLGGEGQIYSGALAAVALGLALPPQWGFLGMVAMLAAGCATGTAVGGLSGILKSKWNADEMITTFLISAALIPMTDALMTASWMTDPKSFLITTKNIPSEFWIAPLLVPSNLHVGAFLALPLLAVFIVLVQYTPWGYRLRMTGRNRQFAAYAGISVSRYSLVPLALSGGIGGLVGALSILGTQHALVQSFSFGWGWNGIAVALIARNQPLAVLPAALLFAYLDQASRSVVLQGQFPFQLSALFQAFILFFITARVWSSVRRKDA